ncbi:tissue-type plasminogen activator-like, partial [Polypterus senegalus]|uniref:tissue-type plasminogen activator-like n=1 Tax=Polypterus senegalus TaxID=55291 RepID=UPI0019659080
NALLFFHAADCSKPECYHGGTCKQALYSPEFICQCPKGFKGSRCEISTSAKCIEGQGVRYRGTWSVTESGNTCLNWNATAVMNKKYQARRQDAHQLGLGNHNYCRNPDSDKQPWCHVYKGSQLTWEYCSIPSCSAASPVDCYTDKGTSYRGTKSVSHLGTQCLHWDSPALLDKQFTAWKPNAWKQGLGSHNYCRNPDNDVKPWCHVRRGRSLTWEYCDIPKCAVCGQRMPAQNQYRIKGGQVSDITSHPWQAAIFIYSPRGQNYAFRCGGVLLDSCWVLSAAHCFPEEPAIDRLQVVLGRTYRVQNSTNEQVFGVKKLFMHEKFNHETYDNDIVLLKLQGQGSRCAQETNYVRPVCLPEAQLTLPDWTECEISGYGKEEEFGAFYSNRLKEGHVRLWPADQCTSDRLSGRLVTKNMLCAGDTRELDDACKGDSGGPLVCSNKGRMSLLGIISWGDGCGKKNTPGVYTKVVNYLDWIDERMKQQMP